MLLLDRKWLTAAGTCCFALLVAMQANAQTQTVNKTDCSQLNQTYGPYTHGPTGSNYQHNTGGHGWTNLTLGKCIYSGTAQVGSTTPCHPHSESHSTSTTWENGIVPVNDHVPTSQDSGGAQDGNNGQPALTDAEGAAAVTSCSGGGCTGSTITIGGSGAGVGFNVSYSTPLNATLIFSDKWYYKNNCSGYTLAALPPPAPSCTTPNPPYPPTYLTCGNSGWNWDVYSCSWVCPSGASPIAIDTKGNRWQKAELFTDPTAGNYVSFDMQGNGIILKLSWPKHGSGVAWLVLDRDGDGVIKDGTELFGNFTPHSDGGLANNPTPNGFNALNWYDQPEQGGNGDSMISNKDAIWSKLRLWFPGEHCYTNKDTACQSFPQELHKLEEFGLTSISGMYSGEIWQDAVGNEYRFQTILNPLAETATGNGENHKMSNDRLGRTSYDVWLKIVR